MLRSVEWYVLIDVSEQAIGPIFKLQATALPLQMGPTGCPETSVCNYQPAPRNIPEPRRYRSYRDLICVISWHFPRGPERSKNNLSAASGQRS